WDLELFWSLAFGFWCFNPSPPSTGPRECASRQDDPAPLPPRYLLLAQPFGPRVKGRVCRQDHRSRQHEQLEVFYMDEVQRRFARNENELAPFLEHHV